ncbi:MAG: heme exporter protein CcmB [Fimbriimonadaceae bacterium]|nr:heme exporter protein CcmB [Fimbriimonadaceae bacterium]
MSSRSEAGLLAAVRAALVKEWRTEMRSKHGLLLGGLYALLLSATFGYSGIFDKPTPAVAAGLLTAGLFCISAVTAPRLFLAEEEHQTVDLMRLTGRPEAIFLGKLISTSAQSLIFGLAVTGGIALLFQLPIQHPAAFWGASGLMSLALAGAFSFTGALTPGAANRWILAAALGIPLLLPQSIMAILAFRFSLGAGSGSEAAGCLAGLAGMAVAMAGLGVALTPVLWGLSGESPADSGSQTPTMNMDQPG